MILTTTEFPLSSMNSLGNFFGIATGFRLFLLNLFYHHASSSPREKMISVFFLLMFSLVFISNIYASGSKAGETLVSVLRNHDIGHHLRGFISDKISHPDQSDLRAVSRNIRELDFFSGHVFLSEEDSKKFCKNPEKLKYVRDSMIFHDKLHIQISDTLDGWKDCLMGPQKVSLKLSGVYNDAKTMVDVLMDLLGFTNVEGLGMKIAGNILEEALQLGNPEIFRKLKNLEIHDNDGNYSLKGLRNLEKLEGLDLVGTNFDNLLSLRDLPELKHLGILRRLTPSDIEVVESLTQLKSLSLDGAIRVSLLGFHALENLQVLNFPGGLPDILPNSLKSVTLNYHIFLHADLQDDLEILSGCLNLTHLQIRCLLPRPITVPSFSKLSKLQSIDFGGFEITSLAFLRGLKELKYLRVFIRKLAYSDIPLALSLSVAKSEIYQRDDLQAYSLSGLIMKSIVSNYSTAFAVSISVRLLFMFGIFAQLLEKENSASRFSSINQIILTPLQMLVFLVTFIFHAL